MADQARLWDARFEEEVLHFLETLGTDTEPALLASLIATLEEGPPDAGSEDLDTRRWARAGLLRRLLALRSSAVEFPERLAHALSSLEREFPRGRCTAPTPDELEIGFGAIPKSPGGALKDLSTGELAALVASPPHFTDPMHGALDERLNELGARDGERFLEVLLVAAKTWKSNLIPGGTEPALGFPNYSAQAFEAWAKKEPEEALVEASLPVWDELFGVSLDHGHSAMAGSQGMWRNS